MALAQPLNLRERISATDRRKRQIRAELRIEEIVAVAGIADEYDKVDRPADQATVNAFRKVWSLVDSDEERAAVAEAFAVWKRHDLRRDMSVRGETDEAVVLLKSHNPIFVEGCYVPDGSDGVA